MQINIGRMRPGFNRTTRVSTPMTRGKKILFTIIGIGLMAGGGIAAYYKYQFITGAAKAEGTVISVVEKRNSDSNNLLYAPVVTFRANNGTVYTFTSNVSTNSQPTVGEKLTVLYEPANPNNASIDSVTTLWLLPLVLAFMGLVFLLIGVFVKIKPMQMSAGSVNVSGLGEIQQFTDLAEENNATIAVNTSSTTPLPPALTAYVQNAFASGQKEDEIRDALKKTGWNNADIDRALRG